MRNGIRAAALLLAAPATAQTPQTPQTAAGTVIRNVADATYVVDGAAVTARSDAAVLTVAERLDVALDAGPEGVAADPDGASIAVPFGLTNRGNGSEAFVLTASAPPAGLTAIGIAADADGDGRPDAGVLEGGRTAAIAAGVRTGFVMLLARDPGTGAVVAGTITIVAHAQTGSGAPGTVYPQAGDDGVDAVVGPTGGTATLALPIAADEPSIVKSQAVAAADGSARVGPGSTITYTLRAHPGRGASAVRVEDPIPAGTRYVANSLRLDDAPLTDAADDDPGACDGSRVSLALPDRGGPAVRIISFQVVIQ